MIAWSSDVRRAVEAVAADLCPGDVAWARRHGLEPRQMVRQAQARSARMLALERDGEFLAVAGIVPVLDGLGAFLISRPALWKDYRGAARALRAALDQLPHPIYAEVAPGDTRTERLAQWLGFTPDPERLMWARRTS